MRWKRPAFPSSAPPSIRSILPRTATASNACSTSSELRQPKNGIAYSVEAIAPRRTQDLGLPLVVRPSYVLGGRAMAILHDATAFDDYVLATLPGLVPSDDQGALSRTTRPGRSTPCSAPTRCSSTATCRTLIEVDVDALCRRHGRVHRRHHGAYRGGGASIPATAPARCRRARCRRRSIAALEGADARLWRWRSTSSG